MRMSYPLAGIMAAVAFLAVLGCTDSDSDPSKDVLTYTRQLKPGMTADEVQALFPKEMHWADDSLEHGAGSMERQYSKNTAVRVVVFSETGHGHRTTRVYFDSEDKLVGLLVDASSGYQLGDDELRFPEEVTEHNIR